MTNQNFTRYKGLPIFFSLLILLSGCELPFEYSPYDNEVKHRYKDLTAKNLAKLNETNTGTDVFKFAFITDTHTFYDEFEDAVEALNKRDDIDFVLHGGDITLSALHKEFTWFNEIMAGLNVPFLTILGNHDHLSNGKRLYNSSFGEINYTFSYKGCKFVMFDNSIWERKNTDPNFEWFIANLKNNNNYNQVIPVSHIPPWGDQYVNYKEDYFNQIMEDKDIKLSIHGHTHSFYHGKKYDKIDFLVGGDIADKHYQLITINKDNYTIENIAF